jgi:hypothetical protein
VDSRGGPCATLRGMSDTKPDLEALLRQLIADNPAASQDDIHRLFVEKVRQDPRMLHAALEQAFNLVYDEASSKIRGT